MADKKEIGSEWVDKESGKVKYKVSENVTLSSPSKDKSLRISSGAQQAAYENISGKTGSDARISPSSPTRGANMDKPYPGAKGTQANHHVTNGKNFTKSRGAAGGSLGAIGGGGMDWETK